MKNQITQELLFNYFSGQVSAIQKNSIEEWAKEIDNREIFYQCLQMWENQHPQYVAAVETAMERHMTRMSVGVKPKTAGYLRPGQSPFYKRIRLSYWGIAASVMLSLLVGWQYRQMLLNKIYVTEYGETRQLRLDDGSRVTLNANSSLAVPRFGFSQKTREVVLQGEAVFSVTHTANNSRFIVKTNENFDVVVFGTEFTVYNRKHAGKIALNKGKVQLRYNNGPVAKAIMMKPGDFVKLNQQGEVKLSKIRKPENLSAWRDNRFVFENTSLEEISQIFEDSYGLQLVVPDEKLAKWTVSGSFTAHNAEELIETLMQASSLTYTRQGNRILIDSPLY